MSRLVLPFIPEKLPTNKSLNGRLKTTGKVSKGTPYFELSLSFVIDSSHSANTDPVPFKTCMSPVRTSVK